MSSQKHYRKTLIGRQPNFFLVVCSVLIGSLNMFSLCLIDFGIQFSFLMFHRYLSDMTRPRQVVWRAHGQKGSCLFDVSASRSRER